jgi:hypothetical protein
MPTSAAVRRRSAKSRNCLVNSGCAGSPSRSSRSSSIAGVALEAERRFGQIARVVELLLAVELARPRLRPLGRDGADRRAQTAQRRRRRGEGPGIGARRRRPDGQAFARDIVRDLHHA